MGCFMKRKEFNLQLINVFADGRIVTGEEFMAQPSVLSGEKNIELLRDGAIMFDPNYRAMEQAKRRFVRTEARKRELEAQQIEIDTELAQL